MWSHHTWCLVVALSVFVSGSKVPRQIVYQLRPAPASTVSSQVNPYYLDEGITEFQFPSYGLKTPESRRALKSPTATVLGLSATADSGDVDSYSSSSSSSSSSRSEEGSSAQTKEEISDVPKFVSSPQVEQQVNRQFLQLDPEQIQQILNAYNNKPQVKQVQEEQPQQQQGPEPQSQRSENIELGPRYEYKSIEESSNTSADDIKAAQTEVITEEKLQSAYSERREKRKRKQQEFDEPPGDASYAFGYETDEAARHEVADADGTVKGWYTYVDDEGTIRKIIYTAGAGKGFVVLGKEKVKGPNSNSGSSSNSQSSSRRKQKQNRGNSDYGFDADSSTISSLKHQKPSSTPASFSNYFNNNWNDLAKAGTVNPPGPTTIIATAETPQRTKKPVFVVKIRRPVNREQFHNTIIQKRTGRKIGSLKEMASDSSSFVVVLLPPLHDLVGKSKVFSDPDPLPLPVTSSKSSTRTRRRPGPMTLSDVVPGLRHTRIKKYPTPPIYSYSSADDDEESDGYDTSNSQGSSSSSSGEYDGDHDSSEQNGDDGYSNGGRGGGAPSKGDTDSSYVYGYTSDSANKLERSDQHGNVRGSYSFIGIPRNQYQTREEPKYRRSPRKSKKSIKSFVDPDGVKRTVHYIAGAKTGFQVIHASPSISRGVRLEAPPGYVVKRVPQSLRAAESRYPIPITVPQPSAIVYHIHPDSGWKPWEPTIRKKKVKIHRKKIPKEYFGSTRRDGIFLLQTHPEPTIKFNYNGGRPSGNSSPYFKEKITNAGSGAVTASETQYVTIAPQVSRRRHAPQRGYTAEHHLVQIDDDGSHEVPVATTHHRHHKSSKSTHSQATSGSSASPSVAAPSASNPQSESSGPGLYSPAPFESMREAANNRMPSAPNPVQLQPTQVAIKSRGAPSPPVGSSGLDTSSSNHHPVAFTSDGKLQVDVPTVIIEAIEAKSQSSLVGKKDENKNIAAIHHKLPEAAALTQTSSAALAASGPSNLIKGPTPTTSPTGYDLVSASSASFQTNSVTVPTPPAASAPSIINSQKTHTTILSSNNNLINHHHHHHSSLPPSSVSSTPPPRSRRRHHHHKSKSNPTVAPTSPSANSASSNTSLNTIKTGVSASLETTTTMSSSKRLINRLAAADHDASSVTAQ